MQQPKIHLKNGGCTYGREPQFTPVPTTGDHNQVTCRMCLKRIAQLNLKERASFPERPEFSAAVAPDEITMSFTCPVCGQVNHHGRGDGHRVSHCPCWKRGYFLRAGGIKS